MERRIGVVGLGKMGRNIAAQLLGKGYQVVVQNRSPGPVEELGALGAEKAPSWRSSSGCSSPPAWCG